MGKQPKTYSASIGRLAKILVGVGLLSILSVLVLNLINLTIHGMRLVWIGAFIGCILALVITQILQRKYLYADDVATIHICFFLGLMLICPSLCMYINTWCANQEVICKSYTVITKTRDQNHGAQFKVNPPWNHHILINIDNKEERFDIDGLLYDKLNEGGQVELYVKHGALGFDYVEKIEAPPGF